MGGRTAGVSEILVIAIQPARHGRKIVFSAPRCDSQTGRVRLWNKWIVSLQEGGGIAQTVNEEHKVTVGVTGRPHHWPCTGGAMTRQLKGRHQVTRHHRPCAGGEMTRQLKGQHEVTRHHRPCAGGEMTSQLECRQPGGRHHRPCVGGKV